MTCRAWRPVHTCVLPGAHGASRDRRTQEGAWQEAVGLLLLVSTCLPLPVAGGLPTRLPPARLLQKLLAQGPRGPGVHTQAQGHRHRAANRSASSCSETPCLPAPKNRRGSGPAVTLPCLGCPQKASRKLCPTRRAAGGPLLGAFPLGGVLSLLGAQRQSRVNAGLSP